MRNTLVRRPAHPESSPGSFGIRRPSLGRLPATSSSSRSACRDCARPRFVACAAGSSGHPRAARPRAPRARRSPCPALHRAPVAPRVLGAPRVCAFRLEWIGAHATSVRASRVPRRRSVTCAITHLSIAPRVTCAPRAHEASAPTHGKAPVAPWLIGAGVDALKRESPARTPPRSGHLGFWPRD
jgi:hypothetical protein